MQKLKKALKKLVNLKTQKPAAAQPAKKSAPVKKKSAPVAPAKKAGAKKAPPAPIKKSAHKPGPAKAKPAAQHKPEFKDKKKPVVHHGKAAEKGHDKHHDKHAAKKPAPAHPAAPAKKAEKPATAHVKPAEAKAKKPEAGPREEADKALTKARTKKPELIEEEVQEAAGPEEVVLTDAEGRRYCRVKDCDQLAMVDTYCRFHYLLYWKNIQVRKKILSEGKLSRYIEELTARYPDKYLEMLKKDLRSEKDFMAAIQELEIDDTSVDSEYEDEAQSYLEEVRGMSSESSSSREEEDF